MDILLIGTLISSETREKFMKLGISPQPADIAQQYILKGFMNNTYISSIHVITSPRIEGYPNNGILKVKDEDFLLYKKRIHTVGYTNISFLGYYDRKKKFIKYCKEWAKKRKSIYENKKLYIIIYSLNSTFLKAAIEVKNILKNVSICVIVADLPQYMSQYTGLKGFIKKRDLLEIELLRKNIDKYILYSKHMAEVLNLRKDKWDVVEGFIDTEKINLEQSNKKTNKKRICVYGGSLDSRYGIQNMIDAFKILKNAELKIYGNPVEARKLKYNINAKYCGMIDPSKMFEIYKKADLLINPRPSDLTLTRYSCPSKTFEYMASGTPMCMCKLDGVPEEYYQYIYTFYDDTKEGMAETLKKLLNKSPEMLREKGQKAAQFLLENKSIDKQVGKIIQLIKNNSRGK